MFDLTMFFTVRFQIVFGISLFSLAVGLWFFNRDTEESSAQRESDVEVVEEQLVLTQPQVRYESDSYVLEGSQVVIVPGEN